MTYLLTIFLFIFILFAPLLASASYHFENYHARPPIHFYGTASSTPIGVTPSQIKQIYHLPETGGRGTIAIIGAFNTPSLESDLNDFSRTFKLPACTVKSGCLEIHQMASSTKTDSAWGIETALDVEWAHAIAPQAKILLVEAETPSGANLLKAIDYVAHRSDIVSVSMSWGGAEFPEETSLDSHFVSKSRAVFFASSGDAGAGVVWPAASPNVIAVGGTSLSFAKDGSFKKESAWSGSGGGVSKYELEPDYQKTYAIKRNKGKRGVPDVAYNADPKSGFPVIRKGVWYQAGGTSAGAPQWAAIQALGNVSHMRLYSDKASENYAKYFRDIVSGSNGSCTYFCNARKHYDYVTGLGSPVTVSF